MYWLIIWFLFYNPFVYRLSGISAEINSHKESVNGYIKKAIDMRIESDNINLRESDNTSLPDSEQHIIEHN